MSKIGPSEGGLQNYKNPYNVVSSSSEVNIPPPDPALELCACMHCVHVCVHCVHVCVHLCACVRVCQCVGVCACASVYISVCISVCLGLHVCADNDDTYNPTHCTLTYIGH